MAFWAPPLDANVRPFRVDDDDFVIALGTRVFAAYTKNPARAIRRMIRRPSHDIAVAEQGGSRVGFVIVALESLGRNFGPLSRPSVAHLDAIAVRPNMSSKGLGHRLLSHAETMARAGGAVSMSLLTAESNHEAQLLFSSAGYQVLTIFDGVYSGQERALSMFKAL